MKNSAAVAMEARPVRPPSATPAEDSTNVVTVEVPQTAPQQVATASASMALSMLGTLPSLVSMLPRGAGAVQRAQGIEHVDHAEGQHGGQEHDDEVAHAVARQCTG